MKTLLKIELKFAFISQIPQPVGLGGTGVSPWTIPFLVRASAESSRISPASAQQPGTEPEGTLQLCAQRPLREHMLPLFA